MISIFFKISSYLLCEESLRVSLVDDAKLISSGKIYWYVELELWPWRWNNSYLGLHMVDEGDWGIKGEWGLKFGPCVPGWSR